MKMMRWTVALGICLCGAWVCTASGQPVNPFAAPGTAGPAATPVATAGQPSVANPFASGGPTAPGAPAAPATVPAGAQVPSPFAAGAAPAGAAPAPTPAAPVAPVTGGAAPGAPTAAPGAPPRPLVSPASPKEETDISRRAQELGMTPSQLRLEIEKSKERITELYARGEYTKALKEIELLENLSPGNPKAVLLRQRIHERALQGRQEGRPIREEFERPVPTMPPSEQAVATPAAAPVPPGPGSLPSPAVPPTPATEPASTTGVSFLIPVAGGGLFVIVAIVAVVFFLTRRSRHRVQEAMTLARVSGVQKPLGSPSFPAPTRQGSRPAAASPFAAVPKQRSAPAPDVFGEPSAPAQEEPPAEPVAQDTAAQEEVYDLPTMILTEDSPESMTSVGGTEGAPGRATFNPFAAREAVPPQARPAGPPPTRPPAPPPVMPVAAMPPSAPRIFDTPQASDTEIPEIHETEGATFKPYGAAERAIGEVVSGVPSADSAGVGPPPPLMAPRTPRAAHAAFSPFADVAPTQPEPAASPVPAGPPSRLPSGETKLELPDIFGADGSVSIEGGEQVVAPGAGGGPLDVLDAVHPSNVAVAPTDFLKSTASAPEGFPKGLSPFASAPPAKAPAAAPPPGTTSPGELSLDDLLFATSRGESEKTQTVGSGQGPAPSVGAGTGGRQAGAGGSPAPPAPPSTTDDLTQMSFGKEFDRLMFAQPGAGSPAGAPGQAAGAGTGSGAGSLQAAQEEETQMGSLFAGLKSAPPAAPGEKTAIIPPPFPVGGGAPARPATSPSPATPKPSLPPTAGPPLPPGETQRFPAQSLEATVKMPAAPTTQSRGTLSEESLYQVDRQKGLEAFAAGDWKQAVHFLSVAASLHPDDQEVVQKLQEARKRRRSAAGI